MMHNEMASYRTIPARVFFFCDVPPPDGAGGETPIARNVDWSAELGPEVMARFAARGISRRVGSPARADEPNSSRVWQNRFQTEDPRVAESMCEQLGDIVEWEADGSLTNRQDCRAVRQHRGETLWFCSPHNTRPTTSIEYTYGDGEPLEPEIVERMRASQWKIAVAFSWRRGDVLCLDNLGCQHGRLSFSEDVDREIFLSIATPRPGQLVEARPGARATDT
jgi:hypothetical protein